uniref:Similar to n=1 Tax=Steinernema glaseri TaxID=37863 RepID=A0A1I7YCS1_9BILA
MSIHEQIKGKKHSISDGATTISDNDTHGSIHPSESATVAAAKEEPQKALSHPFQVPGIKGEYDPRDEARERAYSSGNRKLYEKTPLAGRRGDAIDDARRSGRLSNNRRNFDVRSRRFRQTVRIDRLEKRRLHDRDHSLCTHAERGNILE